MRSAMACGLLALLLAAGCLEGSGPGTTAPQPGGTATSTGGLGVPLPSGLPASGPTSLPASVPTSLPAQPGLPTSLHWNGTVDVEHSIYLLPWQTLTIAPGTVVRVHKLPDVPGTPWGPSADAYVIDHDDPTGRLGYRQSHFEIVGTLVGLGTVDAPIRFTSAADAPGYADWSQLVLMSGSRLENATVEFTHNGVNVQGDDVVVRHVVSHDALWACFDSYGSRTLFEDVEAYHCWHQAVGYKGDHPTTLRRAFLHDAKVGVNCEGGAQPGLAALTLRADAVDFAPDCPPADGVDRLPGDPDVPGGTYGGRLVYPFLG